VRWLLISYETHDGVTSDKSKIYDDFRVLIKRVQVYLNSVGISKKAFYNKSCFESLSIDEKKTVIESLKSYCEVIDNTKAITDVQSEDLKFIWSAIKTYKIIPPSDFLETFKEGYLFEVYDQSGKQFFRNFEFFNVCSYSLEEVFCRSWFDLYSRDEAVNKSIMQTAAQLFNGAIKGTVYKPVPSHLLKEIASESLNEAQVELQAFIPMSFKDSPGRCVAAIAKVNSLVRVRNSSEVSVNRLGKNTTSHLSLV